MKGMKQHCDDCGYVFEEWETPAYDCPVCESELIVTDEEVTYETD